MSSDKSLSTCKVVYLDQKCWINLTKIFFGKASEQEKEIIKKVLEASEKSKAVFPLSISRALGGWE